MEFKCAYKELVDVDKLIPNPKNNNKHPIDQIKRLAKIIDFQGQRSPVVVSNRSGFIVKGHGRLEAIKLLGWEKCAVDYQDYDSEAQEYADMTADNEIAKWAEFQTDMFLEEIKGLDIDPDYFGLKEMPEIGIEEEQDTIYETKIKTPVYEITGEEPKLNELVNTEKADKLKEEIEKSNLPNKVKEFLKLTATRLYEFNYSKIAEYYAHQDKDLQDIMEKLALVIIDYNKAVEYGFVEMTKQIDALVDMGGEDEE